MLIGGPIPPLRADLELTPVRHEGLPFVAVSDIFGLDGNAVLVPAAMLMVASLFDGRKTLKDVQSALAAEKAILSETELGGIIDQLEKHHLLETPAAAERRARLLGEFRKSGVRAMNPAARGLPDNPLELAVFLGKFYEAPGGPGGPPAGPASAPPPLGLVAPHIDFHRGGPHYAWAYKELAQRQKPDLIVALGVAHMSPRSPWVMTRKSYTTPFGPMAVDEGLYEEVRRQMWYDPEEEEWVHAKEHSLEFQAIWLKYLWRDGAPPWVPILCSAYERYCQDRPPSAADSVEKALQGIGQTLAARAKAGQKILVLAGIDLAHVGRRFGDDLDVTPELEKKIETADRASLAQAAAGREDAFFLSGVGDGAWRKVCGLSTLYTALRWTRALAGGAVPSVKTLSYGQAPDPAGGVVSFTSAVLG